MAAKLVASVFALTFVVGTLAAQPDPKSADNKKLVTKVYNVKSLLGMHGKASDAADADGLIKFLLQNVSIGEAKPGQDGPQIVERDGGKFEVRAIAKVHDEIRDLLAALERIQDVAVDVKADVFELDAVAYEKLLKAIPKTKPPVLFAAGEEVDDEKKMQAMQKTQEELNKILKGARLVQTSSGRSFNGVEATISARRVVVPYTNHADEPAGVARQNPLFMKEGFGLVALPVVSFDRRFVRFKITEQSTVVTGMKKRELGEVGGKLIVAQSPVVEDLGATASAVVADGGAAIFRLAYAPKDKVWVVVLKPSIFIQAEEDELKKQEKK